MSSSYKPSVVVFISAFVLATASHAQRVDRLRSDISGRSQTVLPGNTHPAIAQAKPENITNSVPMEHMVLVLRPDANQDAELESLIAQQRDSKSPQYGKFLTPDEYGKRFGLSDNDVAKITAWLSAQGFRVEEIPAGHRSIVFSGSSDQVTAAFNTPIHRYTIGTEHHIANATDPQIPAAMTPVVNGVLKLHDFRHKASNVGQKKLGPLYTAQLNSGSNHYLAPADFATIYNVNSLYANGVNGAGQTIAVVGRSNISPDDVQAFRLKFGLTANAPKVTVVNTDPGQNDDVVEALLDTEWSGAVAPKATVNLVIASSTNTADGIDLSAQYAVNHNVGSIISVSYGACEASMGVAELSFYHALWQQAAAQGISVFVSSGDSGAAGCDPGNSATGKMRGVNGLCSSPYSTCVGGTQFRDTSNPGQYWLSGNNPYLGSAQSYIPEAVWNESGTAGGSGLWASGGGASITFPKPSWQKGAGVPADGVRDVPDVSLTASAHDGYLVVQGGNLLSAAGTSAASPSFAGLMALVNQKTAARQGNANPIFYGLAAKQSTGGAAVFHDITVGSNSVPGVTGFAAVAGYDLATGLGSVDAAQLVNHWNDANTQTASLTLSSTQNTLTLTPGQAAQIKITSTVGGGFNSAVAITTAGAPAGLVATLSSGKLVAPGSGEVTLTLSAARTLNFGTYALTVTGQGASQASKITISVTVQSAGTFALSTSSNYFSVGQGYTGTLNALVTASGGFNAPVSISIPGLPAGVAASASVTPSSNGTITIPLPIVVSKTAAPGVYAFLITATGGGQTRTYPLQLTITGPKGCALVSNPAILTVEAGKSLNFQVSCGSVQGGFDSVLNLSTSSNKPPGVTIQQLKLQTLPGSTPATFAISSANTANPGTYSVQVTGTTSNGFSSSVSIPLTVTPPSTIVLTFSTSTVTLTQGGSTTLQIATRHSGTFSGSVSLWLAGLPAGVTARLSASQFAAPGDGTATVTLIASASAPVGAKYSFVASAISGNITVGVPVALVINAKK